MQPQALESPLARDIARAMIDGFNRHYSLFRAESARARHRFSTCDWHGQQRAQRERIAFHGLRACANAKSTWKTNSGHTNGLYFLSFPLVFKEHPHV